MLKHVLGLFLAILLPLRLHAQVRPVIGVKTGISSQFRPIVGASLGFQNKNLGVSVDYMNYYQESYVTEKGLIAMPSIGASVYSVSKLAKRLYIYGGGGVSYFFPDHDLDPGIYKTLETIKYKPYSTVDNGMGFNVSGGFEIKITKHSNISIGLKQVFFDSTYHFDKKSSATLQGWWLKDEQPIKLDMLIGFMDFRYYF